MERVKCTAIVLSGGSGKRMNSKVHKQYLLIEDKPLICYSIEAFQRQPWIDEIVLVVGRGEIDYAREEIVRRYQFNKVKTIVEGGRERYHSVYQGLINIKSCDYVFIHDGARPVLDSALLERVYAGVRKWKACIPGVPVKDTIKVVGEDNIVEQTPDRSHLYSVQTPQTFHYPLIREAYDRLMEEEPAGITDDAMVAEMMMGIKVYIAEGDYHNIKVTTPEDLTLAGLYLKK